MVISQEDEKNGRFIMGVAYPFFRFAGAVEVPGWGRELMYF